MSSVSSYTAIFLATLLVTGNFIISFLVLLSVTIVGLTLIAILPLWDLTFNSITLIHMIISLGLSVLFSVKVSIAYMKVRVPELDFKFDEKDRRIMKVRLALGQIG